MFRVTGRRLGYQSLGETLCLHPDYRNVTFFALKVEAARSTTHGVMNWIQQ